MMLLPNGDCWVYAKVNDPFSLKRRNQYGEVVDFKVSMLFSHIDYYLKVRFDDGEEEWYPENHLEHSYIKMK